MADSPSSDAPPPSWYPDPKRESELRWWNGRRWTIHTATRAAVDAGEVERPPAVTPSSSPASAAAPRQSATPAPAAAPRQSATPAPAAAPGESATPAPAPAPAAAGRARPKRPARRSRAKRTSPEPAPARPERARAPRARPVLPRPSLSRPSLPKASRLWSRPDAQPDERAATAAAAAADAPAATAQTASAAAPRRAPAAPAAPPAPPQPLTERTRATEATWTATVGAVALIISLFLHWFTLTVNEQGAVQSIPLASSADQWMPGLTWVILAMALVTLVLVLCSGRAEMLAGHRRAAEFSRALDLLVHPAATIAPLAAVAVIAYRVASPPSLPNAQAGLPLHGQVAYGSIVGLICAVAMSLGVAWFAMVTRYRSERPARRRPAATHA